MCIRDSALAVDLLHALENVDAPYDGQTLQVGNHRVPRGRADFEIDARPRRSVLNNRAGTNVAAMFGDHSRKRVQDTGACGGEMCIRDRPMVA